MVLRLQVIRVALHRTFVQVRQSYHTLYVSADQRVAPQNIVQRKYFCTTPPCACTSSHQAGFDAATHLTAFIAHVLAAHPPARSASPQRDGAIATAMRSTTWFPRHLIPNLQDATLHAESKGQTTGTLAALLSDATCNDGVDGDKLMASRSQRARVRTTVEAARLLPVLLREAADELVRFSATGAVPINLLPCAASCDTSTPIHTLVSQPTFMRTMLEQALLTILYNVDNPATRGGGGCTAIHFYRHLYQWRFDHLSCNLRTRFLSCLALLLRASPPSFHVAFELLVRYGSGGAMQQQYCHLLALELFALWWYCNPDQVPIELPLQERLPLVARGDDSDVFHRVRIIKASEQGEDDFCGTCSDHDAVAVVAQSPAVTARVHNFVQALEEKDVRRIHRDGGFLSPRVWFAADYYKQLRTKLQHMAGKSYLISSALLPRVVHVAGALPEPLKPRGRELTRQLWDDWVVPVLVSRSGRTSCRASHDGLDWTVAHAVQEEVSVAGAQRQAVEAWFALFTVAAAAGFVERAVRLLRQRGPSTPTYDELAESLTRSFVTNWSATIAVGCVNDVSGANGEACRTRQLFRLILRGFEMGGVLQPHIRLRPASAAAVWCSLHAKLLSCEPAVCHDDCVATLWTLYALEGCEKGGDDVVRGGVNSAGQSFFAKEMALDAWRRRCAGLRSTTWSAGEVNCEIVDGTAVVRPYVARIQRQIQARSVIACELATVGQAGRGRRLLDRRAYFASTGIICTPTPTLSTSEVSLTEYGAAMIEILHETCSEAMSIVRQHAVRAPNVTTSWSAYPPTTSLYVLVKLLHIIARLGDPFGALAAQPVRGQCDMRQKGPDCAPPQCACAILNSIEVDLVPSCHATVVTCLRRLGLQATGRGSQRGAFELLTQYQGVLDTVHPDTAWARLLEATLWSGVPADVAGRQVTTSDLHDFRVPRLKDDHDGIRTYDAKCGTCFGSGSLAWLLVKLNRGPCLGCGSGCDESSDFKPDQSCAAMLPHTARGLSLRRTWQTMQLLLDHLLTLSLAVPNLVRRAVFLAPFVVPTVEERYNRRQQDYRGEGAVRNQWTVAAMMLTSQQSWIGDNTFDETETHDGASVGAKDKVRGASDDEAKDSKEQACEDDVKCVDKTRCKNCRVAHDTPEETHSRIMTSATANKQVSSTFPSNDEVMNEDSAEGSSTDCALHAQLAWNTPHAHHLFVSWLEVVYWTTNPSINLRRADDDIRQLLTSCRWQSRCSYAYKTLLELWTPMLQSPQRRSKHVHLLQQDTLVEKAILLIIHTCPDVMLLCAALMHCTDMQSACTPINSAPAVKLATAHRSPSCLSRKIELALTHLLYQNGVNSTKVRLWRQKELSRTDNHKGQHFMNKNDLHDLHSRTYSNALSKIRMHNIQQHEQTRMELLILLGSITLASVENRHSNKPKSPSHHASNNKDKKTRNDTPSTNLTTRLKILCPADKHILPFLGNMNSRKSPEQTSEDADTIKLVKLQHSKTTSTPTNTLSMKPQYHNKKSSQSAVAQDQQLKNLVRTKNKKDGKNISIKDILSDRHATSSESQWIVNYVPHCKNQ